MVAGQPGQDDPRASRLTGSAGGPFVAWCLGDQIGAYRTRKAAVKAVVAAVPLMYSPDWF